MITLTPQEQAALPPPKRGCRPATHRLAFHYDEHAARRDEFYDGISVLVSTAPPHQSADELFTKFKQQSYSEHAHHIFKGPLAVHPVFLKTPSRVEALVYLMMVALTLYFLLQRLYRQTVPDGTPPKERRTTTRTIFRAFWQYTLLVFPTAIGRTVHATRLTTRQRHILRQLGFATPAQLLARRLPRAP
jgi:hypothetical protein